MEVVQVDLVDAQSLQRPLTSQADVCWVAVGDFTRNARAEAKLGCEEDVGALSCALEPSRMESA